MDEDSLPAVPFLELLIWSSNNEPIMLLNFVEADPNESIHASFDSVFLPFAIQYLTNLDEWFGLDEIEAHDSFGLTPFNRVWVGLISEVVHVSIPDVVLRFVDFVLFEESGGYYAPGTLVLLTSLFDGLIDESLLGWVSLAGYAWDLRYLGFELLLLVICMEFLLFLCIALRCYFWSCLCFCLGLRLIEIGAHLKRGIFENKL